MHEHNNGDEDGANLAQDRIERSKLLCAQVILLLLRRHISLTTLPTTS